MTRIIVFLFLTSIFTKNFSQSKPPPVITDVSPKYTVVYSNDATYQYVLNTEKLNVLKANTAYLKILTFKSDKEAVLETVFTAKDVKLIDHNLLKTVISQKTDEKPYKVNIIDNKVILVSAESKKKITFLIKGFYDELTLVDLKTGERFDSGNKKKEYNVPLYIR